MVGFDVIILTDDTQDIIRWKRSESWYDVMDWKVTQEAEEDGLLNR